MNKIYRVVWNKSTQTWTAVSEYATAQGKSSSRSAVAGSEVKSTKGIRFIYTALASATLMLVSGQAWAVTGNGSTTGDSKYCFYDATSQSVVCGDATTSTVDTVDGKQPKAVVMGIGATNAGESSIAIGATASSAGAASVAMGNAAKAGANQAVALGQNAQANGQWDISIGRQAGWGAKAPKATDPKGNEGRNIAFGDGALKNGLDVNNNTALGTSAGENLVGSHNIIMGSYSNTENAIESALAAGSTEQQIGVKTREVDTVDNKKRQVKYIESNNSVAIGHRALATGAAGVAVGQQAKAFDATTVAVGNGTRATGNNAVAMGNTANAGAAGAIAIGQHANYDNVTSGLQNSQKYKTTGANSIAIGVRAHSEAVRSIAVGADSSAKAMTAVGGKVTSKKHGEFAASIVGTTTAVGSVAIGPESIVNGTNSVAIGQASEALGQNTFAGGNDSHAIGKSSVAIGDGALSADDAAVAVGYTSKAWGASSTALGSQAQAKPSKSIAVGFNARAFGTETSSISIGEDAYSDASGALAIGKKASAKGAGVKLANGKDNASPYNAIAIGTEANVDSIIAAGGVTQERSTDAIAIGTKAKANYASTIAIGYEAKASTKSNATAIGYMADAQGWKSVAIGPSSTATQTGSVALGDGSVADVGFNQKGSDPLEAKDTTAHASIWTSTTAAVSVGDASKHITRQIINVAAGSQDTDAVNVAQLKAAGFKLNTSKSGTGEVGGTTEEKVKNGETVTIDAGDNIKITQAKSKITVATKKDVVFDSVMAGSGANQVVLSNDGVKVGDNLLNGYAITVDGAKVTNVNSAINQVAVQAFNPLIFAGNTGSSERKLGQTVTISGGLPTTAPSSNSNVHTVVNSAEGKVDIRIADAPTFNGKVSAKGLDAGGQQITGVADGTALSDAVNLDQLQKAIRNANVANATAVHANSPFSYVNNNGEQLVRKADGTFYKANDPSQAPYTSNDITISALNPNAPQTAVPTKVGNIAKGTKDTDVVNVSQLKGVGDALGGGADIDPNTGAFTAPNYIITATDGTQLPPATNVADALKNLNDQVVKPLTFGGDTGTAFERKLGSQVNIKGGATTELTDNNIGVHADNGTLTVKLAKEVNLGIDGSVTMGPVQLNGDGLGIIGGPTITRSDGIKAGNQVISDVKSNLPVTQNNTAVQGEPSNATKAQATPTNANAIKNNAATVSDVLNAGWNVQTNGNATDFVRAYDTVNFADGVGTIITSETDGNKTTFKVDVNAQGLAESAQLPVVYTKKDGTKVYKVGDKFFDNKAGTGTEVPAADIIASMQNADGTTATPTTLANVANGDVTSTSKDAVNGSQLFAQGEGVKNIIGGNTTYDPSNGTYKNADIGGTGKATIDEAIKASKTEVAAGKNVTVTTKTGTNGQTIYTVATKDDVSFNKVTAGTGPNQVILDNSGVKVGGNTYISDAGLNANNKKVTNVADGAITADSKDAVNGSQLYDTHQAIGQLANQTVNLGNQLNNRIGDVEDKANAGVSSAMAMASLPQAYIPGKSMLTGGLATYNGEGAVAVGLSKLSDNGRWVLKMSGSADTKGNAGASIGAGFHF